MWLIFVEHIEIFQVKAWLATFKRKHLFFLEQAARFKGRVRRSNSICGFLDKQSISGQLGFETVFTRQIIEMLTDRP